MVEVDTEREGSCMVHSGGPRVEEGCVGSEVRREGGVGTEVVRGLLTSSRLTSSSGRRRKRWTTR